MESRKWTDIDDSTCYKVKFTGIHKLTTRCTLTAIRTPAESNLSSRAYINH